jgi:hypothetical protein
MEAAEIVAGQETSRRSVSTHMSGQQGTSSAFMMRPETPADSALTALAAGIVRRSIRNTSVRCTLES